MLSQSSETVFAANRGREYSIRALAPMQALVFDWLDKALGENEPEPGLDVGNFLDVFTRYMRSGESRGEAQELVKSVRAGA